MLGQYPPTYARPRVVGAGRFKENNCDASYVSCRRGSLDPVWDSTTRTPATMFCSFAMSPRDADSVLDAQVYLKEARWRL
jgi:hypothetical protein